jgi:hypothetical protein
MIFDLPGEIVPLHPIVTVKLNGVVLERIAAGTHVERDYKVEPGPGINVLELDTTQVLSPSRQHIGDDPRELGLQVRYLSWGPD